MNAPMLCKCRETLSDKVYILRKYYKEQDVDIQTYEPDIGNMGNGIQTEEFHDILTKLFPNVLLNPCCIANLLTCVDTNTKQAFFNAPKRTFPKVRR